MSLYTQTSCTTTHPGIALGFQLVAINLSIVYCCIVFMHFICIILRDLNWKQLGIFFQSEDDQLFYFFPLFITWCVLSSSRNNIQYTPMIIKNADIITTACKQNQACFLSKWCTKEALAEYHAASQWRVATQNTSQNKLQRRLMVVDAMGRWDVLPLVMDLQVFRF